MKNKTKQYLVASLIFILLVVIAILMACIPIIFKIIGSILAGLFCLCFVYIIVEALRQMIYDDYE